MDDNYSGFDYDYFQKSSAGASARSWIKRFIPQVLEKRIPIYRYLKKHKNNGTLLDFGCGLGHFLEWAQKDFKTYGVDPSLYAVKEAQKRARQSRITQLIDSTLPFSGEIFDAVVSFDVVEHLPDPEKTIRDIRKVLKQGGIFCLSTPNPSSLGKKIKKEKWFGFQDSSHCSIKKTDEWKKILTQAGFSIQMCEYDFLWNFPYLIKKRGILRKLVEGFIFMLPTFPLYFLGINRCSLLGENLFIIGRKETESGGVNDACQ